MFSHDFFESLPLRQPALPKAGGDAHSECEEPLHKYGIPLVADVEPVKQTLSRRWLPL